MTPAARNELLNQAGTTDAGRRQHRRELNSKTKENPKGEKPND